MRPPRMGRRWIRFVARSAGGWSGRGGRSWRLRWGRRPLYWAGMVRRCSWPKISIWSVTSGRAVSTNRFRVCVRSRAAGRDLHGLDTGLSQDGVERCGELPGPVADQEPEVRGAIAQIHQQVADLLGSPGPVRVRGDAEDVHVARAGLHDNRQYRRCRVTAQSTWKKSVASIVAV